MKCVKFYRPHGGHVARLTDADAGLVVKSGKGIYCPKHWYRAARLIEADIGGRKDG